MVPALTIAIRCVPRRGLTIPATRSQLTRGTQFGKFAGGIAAGEQVEHAFEQIASQFTKRCRTADDTKQLVDRHGFERDHGHQLLSQHIEWVAGIESLFDFAAEHPFDGGTAGQQVAAVLGEDHALRCHTDLVTGPADALDARGDGGRRFDLNHQVHRAHIDAQLQ